jgi:hypothetical protein
MEFPAMMARFGLIVVLLAGLAAPALADAAAGDRCAKSLPPDAKMIYRDAAPDLTRSTTIRAVLTSHVRRMVFEGRIKLSDARPAATAAAACLQALQN